MSNDDKTVSKNNGGDSFCYVHSANRSWNLTGDNIIDSSSPASLPSPNPDFSQISAAFPSRVHFMLSEMKREGLDHIASWQFHGRSFIVTDRKALEEQIIPNYFQQSKFSSFQRQLNFYGFRRITTGKDKGGYFHEFFQREQPSLSFKIQRVNDKKIIRRSNHQFKPTNFIESNLHSLPLLPDVSEMKAYIEEAEGQASNSSSRSCFLDLRFLSDVDNEKKVPKSSNISEYLSLKHQLSLKPLHNKQVTSRLEGIFPQVSYHESVPFISCQSTQSQHCNMSCITFTCEHDSYSLRGLSQISPLYLKSSVDTMLNSILTLHQLV